MDLLRCHKSTGTHGAHIFISPSFNVTKLTTSGDFNSFLQLYSSALKALRKLKRRDVQYDISEVWERYHGRGGLSQMEALCAALLKEWCDEDLVEEAKDIFLDALISHVDTKKADI